MDLVEGWLRESWLRVHGGRSRANNGQEHAQCSGHARPGEAPHTRLESTRQGVWPERARVSARQSAAGSDLWWRRGEDTPRVYLIYREFTSHARTHARTPRSLLVRHRFSYTLTTVLKKEKKKKTYTVLIRRGPMILSHIFKAYF